MPAGTLAVELDEAVRGLSQKRVETRSRRDCDVARIDRNQLTFDLRQAEIVDNTRVSDCGVFHLLNCGPDGFADLADACEVSFGDKVRPKIRRKPAAAKDEFGAFEALIEQGSRRFGQFLICEQIVITGNGLWEHGR